MPSFTFPATADAETLALLPNETRGTTNPIGLSVALVFELPSESFIRFDLFSQIPPGSTITAATMTLDCAGVGSPIPVARIMALTGEVGSWAEATVTWNTRPTAVGVQAVSASMFKGLIAFTGAAMIAVIQEAVTNNYQSGFRIDDSSGVGVNGSFYSKEAAGHTAPSLAVTWTVPAGGPQAADAGFMAGAGMPSGFIAGGGLA